MINDKDLYQIWRGVFIAASSVFAYITLHAAPPNLSQSILLCVGAALIIGGFVWESVKYILAIFNPEYL